MAHNKDMCKLSIYLKGLKVWWSSDADQVFMIKVPWKFTHVQHVHTLTSPTAIDSSALRNIEKPCMSVCPYFTLIILLTLYTCSVNSVHPQKYVRVQNCPDITILVSHDVSNGAGHGGVGHRIYHGTESVLLMLGSVMELIMRSAIGEEWHPVITLTKCLESLRS